MKGSQSTIALESYFDKDPVFSNRPMQHKKGKWTLKECLKKYNFRGYPENQYIAARSYKYHTILIEAIKHMPTNEIVNCIKETFVEAPQDQFKPGEVYAMLDSEYLPL